MSIFLPLRQASAIPPHQLVLVDSTENSGTSAQLEIQLKNPQLPDTSQLRLSLELGRIYNNEQDDRAPLILGRAIKLAKSLGKINELSVAIGEMGRYYLTRAENDKATQYFNELLDLGKQNNNLQSLAIAYKGLGVLNFNLGIYEVAIKQMEQALDAYTKLDDIENMAKCNLNLGIFFSVNGKLANIINYYRRAEALFRKAKSDFGIAKAHHSLASAYYNLKDYQSTLHFANLSIGTYSKLGNEVEANGQLGLKALALAHLGQHKEALRIVNQSLTVVDRFNDPLLKSELLAWAAEVAQLAGETNLQLSYAIQLGQIATLLDNKRLTANALRFEADALAKQGNYQQSYQKLDTERLISDSLNDANFQDRLRALETHYQLKQKDSQIEDLEITAKEQESILTFQDNQLLLSRLLIGGMILLIGIAFWFYLQDKKTRKRLEQHEAELLARNEQLNNLNKSKNKLFRIMAHDLRGPIGSLMHLPTIYDNLFLARDLTSINEMNQVVFKTMKQLHQLMDSLLTWATAESGQITITPERLRVLDLFTAVQNLFAENLVLKNLTLTISLPDQAEIWADNNSVYTVLRNLISNAIKFSHPGSDIQLVAKRDGDWMQLSVLDTGKGMPADLLEKLFLVGENKKSLGTQGEKGTGLGMLIVKEMVSLNKGQLLVQSEFGKGTDIAFWVPLKNQEEYSTSRPSVSTKFGLI